MEPEFVRVADGLRVVTPGYAAVELAAHDDGRAICEALRLRLTRQSELSAACASLAATPGHAARRRVVDACRVNPWSYAELVLGRILRAAGITGWKGNIPITLDGQELHPDILFLRVRVVIEFDGRETHDNATQFLKDRERLNIFAAHGYVVVRFGWAHLDQPGYIVDMVRRALTEAGPTGATGGFRHQTLRTA